MRFIVSCLVLTIMASANAGDKPPSATLRIVGDNWCPYNCAADSQLPGYLVEVIRRVLGSQYRIDYRVVPWTRAVEMVSRSEADLLLATTPETTPGLRLTEPVGIDRSCLFVRADSTWRFRQPADLDRITLGVIQDYKYDADGPIDRLIARRIATRDRRIEVATGEDALGSNFRKLRAGRMDALIENENVGAWTINQLGRREALVNAGCVSGQPGTIHIALAPAHQGGTTLLGAIDNGIVELRKRGELAAILARYGIADWRPLLKRK